MLPTNSGAIRLFRFSGIQVYLHWTWFLAAWYFLAPRGADTSRLGWNIAAYITLFLIVLIHEFGHALAARQVGGEAREIILWPFGGIAFAKVPPRPGAELWAVAAGPLVNVILWPILWAVTWYAANHGWQDSRPELLGYLATIFWINQGLLIFNVLPVYPLDGGQMLRALLWYKFGRIQSLRIATIVGFVGVAVLIGRALLMQSLFSGMIAAFVAMECWSRCSRA
jgi:Zn-dependent protease